MKMKISRPVLLAGVCAIVLAAAILAWLLGTYTWVDSVRYRKDAETLDLSGHTLSNVEQLDCFSNLKALDLRGTGVTVAQYEALAAQHPGCQIRWDVPFQGSFLEEGTESITPSALTDEDVNALQYVTTLKTVDSAACKDYAQLAKLQKALPGAVFTHEVPLGGELWPNDTKQVVLENAKAGDLMEQLSWLASLEKVQLLGDLPSPDELDALAATYPGLDFSWQWSFAGKTLETDDTAFELSGQKLSLADLDTILAYGPDLTKLVVTESGLSSDDLFDFQKKHPEVELVWDILIEGRSFRTDATELDLSHVPLTSVEQVEKYFPCFPHLTRVDMSYTGLSNEELDALNKKYENIRIVWLVQICEKGGIMTDATYFMPYQLGTIVTDKEMELLKYCPDIICVDVGHMKITNCEFVKYLPKLQYLIVADTPVDSLEPLRGHESLIFLEAFLTDVTDYTPLLECPNLLDLNITNNWGDLTPLTKMTWLERLWIAPLGTGSYKGMPEVLMLQEALPNTLVVYSDNSTGAGWREHPRYFEMRDILGMFYLK